MWRIRAAQARRSLCNFWQDKGKLARALDRTGQVASVGKLAIQNQVPFPTHAQGNAPVSPILLLQYMFWGKFGPNEQAMNETA